jgi:hypothetical protein
VLRCAIIISDARSLGTNPEFYSCLTKQPFPMTGEKQAKTIMGVEDDEAASGRRGPGI